MKKKMYKLEKMIYVQFRYYETMYKIKDQNGEVIFTGSEEMAKKLTRVLERESFTARKRVRK